jgi:hypothetical protein
MPSTNADTPSRSSSGGRVALSSRRPSPVFDAALIKRGTCLTPTP